MEAEVQSGRNQLRRMLRRTIAVMDGVALVFVRAIERLAMNASGTAALGLAQEIT
jgi:hypothetical protein